MGCIVVIVLAIAGLSLGANSLISRLQHGGFSCLPSDFPVYPGATYAQENFNLNAGAPTPTPGNTCQMVFESNDSAGTVLDFYQSRLDSGGW